MAEVVLLPVLSVVLPRARTVMGVSHRFRKASNRLPACLPGCFLLLACLSVRYVAYLGDYAAAFAVLPLVRFHTRVHRILKPAASPPVTPHPEGGPYRVELVGASTGRRLPDEVFDAVAVCSGLHNEPRVPAFPNQVSKSRAVTFAGLQEVRVSGDRA
jgi:hypothetical protein